MSVMGTRRRARLRPSRRGGGSPGPRASVRSRSARAPRRHGGARGCPTSRRSWRRSRSAHTSAGARRAPARASTAGPIAACSAGSGARRGPCRRRPRSARRTIRSFLGSALDRACLLAGRVAQVRLDGRGRLVELPGDLGDRAALVAVVLRLQHLAPAPDAAVLGVGRACGSLNLPPLALIVICCVVQSVGHSRRRDSFWPDPSLPARRPELRVAERAISSRLHALLLAVAQPLVERRRACASFPRCSTSVGAGYRSEACWRSRSDARLGRWRRWSSHQASLDPAFDIGPEWVFPSSDQGLPRMCAAAG